MREKTLLQKLDEASSVETGESILNSLADDTNYEVSANVAGNLNAPASVLRKLSGHSHQYAAVN